MDMKSPEQINTVKQNCDDLLKIDNFSQLHAARMNSSPGMKSGVNTTKFGTMSSAAEKRSDKPGSGCHRARRANKKKKKVVKKKKTV